MPVSTTGGACASIRTRDPGAPNSTTASGEVCAEERRCDSRQSLHAGDQRADQPGRFGRLLRLVHDHLTGRPRVPSLDRPGQPAHALHGSAHRGLAAFRERCRADRSSSPRGIRRRPASGNPFVRSGHIRRHDVVRGERRRGIVVGLVLPALGDVHARRHREERSDLLEPLLPLLTARSSPSRSRFCYPVETCAGRGGRARADRRRSPQGRMRCRRRSKRPVRDRLHRPGTRRNDPRAGPAPAPSAPKRRPTASPVSSWAGNAQPANGRERGRERS